MSKSVLRRKNSDGSTEDFELAKPVTTIGRSRSNDIVINDTSVSRLHVRIENRNGQFFILDNNSSNGTFLNKKKIGEAPIRAGDQLVTGRISFDFMELEAPAVAAEESATATLPTLDSNQALHYVKSTRPMQALPPDHDRTLRSGESDDPFWTPPPSPAAASQSAPAHVAPPTAASPPPPSPAVASTPPPPPTASPPPGGAGGAPGQDAPFDESLLEWDDSALDDLGKTTPPPSAPPRHPAPPPMAASPPSPAAMGDAPYQEFDLAESEAPTAPPQPAPQGRFPLPQPGDGTGQTAAAPPPPPAGGAPQGRFPLPVPGVGPDQPPAPEAGAAPKGRFPLPVPGADPEPPPPPAASPQSVPQPEASGAPSIFDNAGPAASGKWVPAEPTPRMMAFGIDVGVAIAVQIPGWILGFIWGPLGTIWGLLAMVALLAHPIVGWLRFGKTIGKYVMKLKVIEESHPRAPGIGPQAIAFRMLVTAFTLGVSFLFIFKGPEFRTLHDKIAGTKVIKDP
ncbi:FHA domain-containing protein [Acanthopleuribacter pedis]|uniref:FHA domain-containing protein n=1 Tax=Acanthopleuribacter pedis TaxID=442870 RepID=A0A8J7U378_9BACT|nr:FHA domain-containing protein [Acanthopleuribacter pedis]MBO1320103.1 FHA domain-containing protein [Acanthopleuribacter pedis]